jgi:hypothetical protein
MKFITPLILGTVFLSIFNCKSSKESTLQLQSSFPIEITAPYYNSWVAGIEGGGAGINVFLPLKENAKISIDSLHFRGEKSAVETRDKLIIGRFRHSTNPKKDIIMSSNPQDEYNNKRVLKRDTSPFSLTQNECVISYRVKDKRLYYKLSNLKKGEAIAYPSAPPKNR